MRIYIDAPATLDFDIENRPLSYWTDDRPSAEVTAIAWSWMGEAKVEVRLLGEVTLEKMLEDFVEAYDVADIVTGHYITRHDLPIINGALMEVGATILGPKLASDTKTQLVEHRDLPVNQESLALYLGVPAPKEHMTQYDWRMANRLGPEGLAATRRRVVGDVKQHKLMREELIKRGLLKGPVLWEP